MKIIFISNYMTHHQLPFCKFLYERFGNDFSFVATMPIEKERSDLGFSDFNTEFEFIVRTYDGPVERFCVERGIMDADVVILGDAPLHMVKSRLKANKLTFRYSERIYKQGHQIWKLPVRIIKHYMECSRYKNFYLLCASAYAAGDYAKTGMFLNRAYRWGYFPEVKQYEKIDHFVGQKEPATIMWAGRFIDWKHPDRVIQMASRLKEDGYKFKLRMIGMGDMDEQLRQSVEELQLGDCVEFTGPLKPEEVRVYMEKTQIYLFTSDRKEGWGAVLNESMNSGCAVVASSAAGSTPFLVKSGENGFTYDYNSDEQLYRHVCTLLNDQQLCARLGKNAYKTMTELWNAECATRRLIKLCETLLQGHSSPTLFTSGPCSKAEVIKD